MKDIGNLRVDEDMYWEIEQLAHSYGIDRKSAVRLCIKGYLNVMRQREKKIRQMKGER